METKLDQGTHTLVSSHCCPVLVGCCLLAGSIHRQVLPMWWRSWPPAAPGLSSTIDILGTHRVTRGGIFLHSFSRSHWEGLSLSSALWPRRCAALIGWVWASLDTEGNCDSQKGQVTYPRSQSELKYVSSDHSSC